MCVCVCVCGEGGGGVREVGRTMASPPSISKPSKIQEFQFQTSGILLFIGVVEIIRTRNFTTFTV